MSKFIIPNKREDAIKFFRENLADVYELKKKTIKVSDSIYTSEPISFDRKTILFGVDKSTHNFNEVGEARATFVANTYLWLDSHLDVHDIGVFKNSIKEQKDKLFHLHDHKFELTARVGDVENVAEEFIDWRELGVDKDGQTQILKVKSNILKRYNYSIFNDYVDKRINQHSVSMRYIKLKFAMDDKESEEAYKTYAEYIDRIGNREKAEELGYFWVVKEAALREFSCVLLGSNELTPTLSISDKNNAIILSEKEKALKNFLNIK
jgi:hypothetical protein